MRRSAVVRGQAERSAYEAVTEVARVRIPGRLSRSDVLARSHYSRSGSQPVRGSMPLVERGRFHIR